jgi:hypothetical protein
MATPRQYWNAVRNVRNAVCLAMGTDFTFAPPQLRALSNADLAALVIVIKALTDNGILTDAQLQAAQQAIAAELWDVEAPLP